MNNPIERRAELLGALSNIPDVIIMKCLSFLSPNDLRIVSFINTKFRQFTSESNEQFWKDLCRRDFKCLDLGTFTAKRCYQVLSDMKNGRYLLEKVNIEQVDVVALIGDKTHFKFKTEKKQAGLHIPPSLMHLSLPKVKEGASIAHWKWNGRYLATTCIDQDFLPIDSGEITIWEIKEGCLIPCQTLKPALEDVSFFALDWQKNQLVLMALKDDGNAYENDRGHYILEVWEPGEQERWSLIYSLVLPYVQLHDNLDLMRVLGDNTDFFAWDGEWLAFIPPDLDRSKRAPIVDIWRKNDKGILEKICEKNLGSSVSSVKWHGKFLFAGDVSGNIMIWDRESHSVQNIPYRFPFYPDQPAPTEENSDLDPPNEYVHHFIFLNHFVLITTHWGRESGRFSTSISLWEQYQDGILKKVDDLICAPYEEFVTVLNDQTSFLILDRYQKSLWKMSFGNSYQKIFEQLAHNYGLMAASSDPLHKTDIWHNRNRFYRMPKSQKSEIGEESRKFLVYQKLATNQMKKDAKGLCLALAQGIRLYINKTHAQPLTSIPQQRMPERMDLEKHISSKKRSLD